MIFIRGTSKRVEVISYWGEETDKEIIPKPWWNAKFRIMARLKDIDYPMQPDIEIEAQHLVADGGIAELKRAFDNAVEVTRY